MKRIKDNWWNRIFHHKALKDWNHEAKKLRKIIGWYKNIIEELNEAKSLEEILSVHKHAWEVGFQNINLAPCEWGMFRTHDILQMQPSEVYLGGIWGLTMKNIPFWNDNREETMAGNGFGIDDNKLIYDIIMQQYRNHLRSNFQAIRRDASNTLYSE